VNDRTARLLASVSIAIAVTSVIVAMYALSLVQERSQELRTLTDGVQRALAAQRAMESPLRGPPPSLDPGD
jgi:hypothetical protein